MFSHSSCWQVTRALSDVRFTVIMRFLIQISSCLLASTFKPSSGSLNLLLGQKERAPSRKPAKSGGPLFSGVGVACQPCKPPPSWKGGQNTVLVSLILSLETRRSRAQFRPVSVLGICLEFAFPARSIHRKAQCTCSSFPQKPETLDHSFNLSGAPRPSPTVGEAGGSSARH